MDGSVDFVELFQSRSNKKERAIEFFTRVYGTKDELVERQFYADDLLRRDAPLYRALANHQHRSGATVLDLLPSRHGQLGPGRPRKGMVLTEAQLAERMRHQMAMNRERSRRFQQRQKASSES
ncbi:hypothetical protein [Phenylobacterium sp.]|uniref:hypothetical protein n=1 Tax=Phenylobacterium sp. TaxID=1871053 RepID=UPI0035B13CA7